MKFNDFYNNIIRENSKETDPELEKQIKMGKKVEKEHNVKAEKAKEIAKQHLKEDPKYYTKLKKAGL